MAADRERGDRAPVLCAQISDKALQCVTERLRMEHQAPHHSQRQDRRSSSDEKSEMRTVGAGHAQGEQPAKARVRDHVCLIVKERAGQARLS